jgi:hypothetical protein
VNKFREKNPPRNPLETPSKPPYKYIYLYVVPWQDKIVAGGGEEKRGEGVEWRVRMS